jgi:hypothetical protein
LLFILEIIAPLQILAIKNNQNFPFFSTKPPVFKLIYLAFLVGVGWPFLPRVVETLLGENKIIVGAVTLQYRGSGRSSRLYYIVNNLELQVGFNDYYNLVEGLVYQVHYTRWSKRIVSIEPV